MTASPDGLGYWIVASDGGIFAYGSAPRSSAPTAGRRSTTPIVGMAAAPNGQGYWLVASDGGIFAYGPGAGFFGSHGGSPLNAPIVGMAAASDGQGYWFVASDGGIFAYGPSATFFGSHGGSPLNKPIVAMATAPAVATSVTSNNLVQVSCPTTTWCAAVDGSGNAYTTRAGNGPPVRPVGSHRIRRGLVPDHHVLHGRQLPRRLRHVQRLDLERDERPHVSGAIPNASFTGVSCATTTFCAVSDFLSGHEDVYTAGVWTVRASAPPSAARACRRSRASSARRPA